MNIYSALFTSVFRMHHSRLAQSADAVRTGMHYRPNYMTAAGLLLIVGISYIGLASQGADSHAASSTSLPSSQTTQTHKAVLNVSGVSASDTPAPANTPSQPAPDSKTNADSANNSTVQVTVNGQSIDVPQNGSINQTVPTENGNGQTTVSASRSQTSTGQASNYNFSSTISTVTSGSSDNSVNLNTETTEQQTP